MLALVALLLIPLASCGKDKPTPPDPQPAKREDIIGKVHTMTLKMLGEKGEVTQRALFTYNKQLQQTAFILEDYVDGKFVLDTETEYIYDASGHLTLRKVLSYERDSEGTLKPSPKSQDSYTYDQQGRLRQHDSQQFNGYCRVPIPVGNTDATGIYHGGTGDLDMAPAYRRGKIRGILVTAEARISPSSPNGSRAAFQMGGDWKWRNDGAILAWYPGFGLSATTQLSKEWQRFYHCALRPGPDVSRESRALSVDAFRRTRIPLPDMGSSTQTSPPIANPWPDQPPAPPPPTDSRTFASLRGRHNMLHIKQTPDQKGENRWIVEWLGIENGKVMDNSIVEKDAAMLASREWVGTKTIPAIVWTSNQPLPNDLSDYFMTTLTADRSSFNSVAPYYDIGIWRDNATVANTEESRKK